MSETILRLPTVIARTGLSKSTIYDLIEAGKFPEQIKLGPRTVGWIESEIDGFINRKITESRSNPGHNQT